MQGRNKSGIILRSFIEEKNILDRLVMANNDDESLLTYRYVIYTRFTQPTTVNLSTSSPPLKKKWNVVCWKQRVDPAHDNPSNVLHPNRFSQATTGIPALSVDTRHRQIPSTARGTWRRSSSTLGITTWVPGSGSAMTPLTKGFILPRGWSGKVCVDL